MPIVKPIAAAGIKEFLGDMWKAIDPAFTKLVEEILALLGISQDDLGQGKSTPDNVEANIVLNMKLPWNIIILIAVDIGLSLLTLILFIPKVRRWFEKAVVSCCKWWKPRNWCGALKNKVGTMCARKKETTLEKNKKKKKEVEEKTIRKHNTRKVKQYKKDVEDIYYH